MPKFIAKIDGLYCEWSTIVDAPVTAFMTLEKFKAHYLNEYGEDGMRRFDERMRRVESKGVSAHHYESVSELISGNRAGPEESCLSKEKLLEIYRDD